MQNSVFPLILSGAFQIMDRIRFQRCWSRFKWFFFSFGSYIFFVFYLESRLFYAFSAFCFSFEYSFANVWYDKNTDIIMWFIWYFDIQLIAITVFVPILMPSMWIDLMYVYKQKSLNLLVAV